MTKGDNRELKHGYLLVGNTCLPTEFSVFLRGDELKRVLKEVREGEDVRITIGDRTFSIEAVDTYNKYPTEKSVGVGGAK